MGLGAGFLGAIVGGMFGGPWGAIIGGTLGLLISGNKSSNTKENSNASNGTFEFAIWKSMFQCMGKIAKSDGRVSEDEAEYIHQLLLCLQFICQAHFLRTEVFVCDKLIELRYPLFKS